MAIQFKILKNLTAVSLLSLYVLFGAASIMHHHNISLSNAQEINSSEDQHTLDLELCMPLHTHILSECFFSDCFQISNQKIAVQSFSDEYSFEYTSNLYNLKNRRGPPTLV